MEWGFALAIIGIIVVLISTIWYFASYLNQLHSISAFGTNPIVPASQHTQAVCTAPPMPASVPATGNNVSLKEALALTAFPTLSVIGWLAGAGMIIGGVIWGLIARSKSKPDSAISRAINALILQEQMSPVVKTQSPPPIVRSAPAPAASPALSAEELAKLKALLASA